VLGVAAGGMIELLSPQRGSAPNPTPLPDPRPRATRPFPDWYPRELLDSGVRQPRPTGL